MEHPKFAFRDPADLRLHPLQKNLPDPDKHSPEWLSFVEGIAASGPQGIPPLIISREGLIMDGGRRWRAVKQLQWESVAVMERPEHEAAALIVDTLLGQRNLPRGTKVYLALGLLPDWVKASETRRLEHLKHGVKNTQKANVLPSKCDTSTMEKHQDIVALFSERMGVSRDVFNRALRVRKLLDADPALKELHEAELMTGEKSLWNVEAAIKGSQTDQSKREAGVERSQLELFGTAFDHLRTCAKGWARFTQDNQQHVLSAWKTTVKAMPAELRLELAVILEEASPTNN